MSTNNNSQYQMIARDIAKRIISHEWDEGQMLSGRSILSSEYAVSPETIRRSLALLANMKVVKVKRNVGVFILSVDNARRYMENFDHDLDMLRMKEEFSDLVDDSLEINKKLFKLFSDIISTRTTISYSNSKIPVHEAKIEEDSHVAGKNIGSIRFWQNTQATIIAIKRGQNVIISPGPDAELYGNDIIVFVGSAKTKAYVDDYINGVVSLESKRSWIL